MDIAGLVRGASRGEGLGNRFLSHIREVDALVHVVRCFSNDDVAHVEGGVGPSRDIETVNIELVLSDLDTLEKRFDRTAKQAKSGDKKLLFELETLERLRAHLEKGLPARTFPGTEAETALVGSLFLLTAKPTLYAANIGEEDIVKDARTLPLVKEVEAAAGREGSRVLSICARVEEEIAMLPLKDRGEFLNAVGLEESGLDRLAREGYALLDLIKLSDGRSQGGVARVDHPARHAGAAGRGKDHRTSCAGSSGPGGKSCISTL